MAKKLDSIVELAAQKTREISANSGNYMAFLTTAAHNFKYNFRDQLLIYAQKPDATACAQIDFWNKHGRYVNQGTRGIALLVDTDRGGMSLICLIPTAARGAPSPSGRWSRGMRTR